MGLIAFEVGKPFPYAEGRGEGCFLHVDENGPLFIYSFNHPSKTEIDQLKTEHTLEMRFLDLYGIMFFLLKAGSLNWVDAPFSPSIVDDFVLPPIIRDEKTGYPLQIMMIDSDTTIVKSIRLVGMDHQFSMSFRECLEDLSRRDFDVFRYQENIASIYKKYSTKDMVKMSRYKFKL